MNLIYIITITLMITTTLNIVIQVVSGLLDERKLFKEKGESFPKWTYSYTVAPQVVFLVICTVILNLSVPNYVFTLSSVIVVALILYVIFLISSSIGTLIVALLQKRDK